MLECGRDFAGEDMIGDLGQGVEAFAQWMYESRYLVVLTGAGISTESGVPDFRQGETPFDSVVNLRFREKIGDVLPRAVRRLKKLMGLFE
jgi:NAD-dependent SIR2 family protein deacetylase